MALDTLVDPVTDPSFDARWAAWQRRGASQDRISRRRIRILLPVLGLLVAGACYILLLR